MDCLSPFARIDPFTCEYLLEMAKLQNHVSQIAVAEVSRVELALIANQFIGGKDFSTPDVVKNVRRSVKKYRTASNWKRDYDFQIVTSDSLPEVIINGVSRKNRDRVIYILSKDHKMCLAQIAAKSLGVTVRHTGHLASCTCKSCMYSSMHIFTYADMINMGAESHSKSLEELLSALDADTIRMYKAFLRPKIIFPVTANMGVHIGLLLTTLKFEHLMSIPVGADKPHTELFAFNSEDVVWGVFSHDDSIQQNVTITEKPICNWCKQEAVFACAKCRLPSYCSRECQVADWKYHKKECDLI